MATSIVSRTSARTELFEALDGRSYTLDGISGTLVFTTYRAIYPYDRTVEKLEHRPDRRGKATPEYQRLKDQLHDDWMTDLTDSHALVAIAQELGVLSS